MTLCHEPSIIIISYDVYILVICTHKSYNFLYSYVNRNTIMQEKNDRFNDMELDEITSNFLEIKS